jgi:hypothetical protein
LSIAIFMTPIWVNGAKSSGNMERTLIFIVRTV